jgi:polyhydroxyalkanoate synthase
MSDMSVATRDRLPLAAPIATPAPQGTAAGLDQMLHAWQSRFTGGRPPSMMTLATLDWAAHAVNSPFQTAAYLHTAVTQWQRLGSVAMGGAPVIAPAAGDRRFAATAWQQAPFNLLTQAVLLGEEWWAGLVETPPGVSPPDRRLAAFTVRQWLDLISPSNLPWMNPEVIAATYESGGANLTEGLCNLLRDLAPTKPAGVDGAAGAFTVGVTVACTPGEVVFRNELMELIQYAPTTDSVAAEPILIIPAWIMKYYILDLSPGNSMVRWLVAQGHTVFMISWRNPTTEMRDTSLDDYRSQGLMAAVDAVSAICGGRKMHAIGYCLGGTLLSIAAAAMARDGDDRLASLSLLAAQTDFTEPGDLKLFITEDQLAFLDDMMKTQGFLSSAQMGGAFQTLQARNLVWGYAIRDYLLGERDKPNDMVAWDADGTRLPARMHIEYLRSLFLNNDLAEGHFLVGGRPLELDDIRLPIFLVGNVRDEIAPWQSVFKLHGLNHGEMTFVLTSGGHNAGIVSEPGHPHHHYAIRTRSADGLTLGPAEWQQDTPQQEGSWWPDWGRWLDRHGGGRIAPPSLGAAGYPPLADAPGEYVREA